MDSDRTVAEHPGPSVSMKTGVDRPAGGGRQGRHHHCFPGQPMDGMSFFRWAGWLLPALLTLACSIKAPPRDNSGTAGASGAAGTSGTAGTMGAAGTSGTAGTTGKAGTTGTAGTSGTAGATGSAGTSGS